MHLEKIPKPAALELEVVMPMPATPAAAAAFDEFQRFLINDIVRGIGLDAPISPGCASSAALGLRPRN